MLLVSLGAERSHGQKPSLSSPTDGIYVLPDTGAVGNVCGADWANVTYQKLKRLSLPVELKRLVPPHRHGGVGNGATFAKWMIRVPLTIGKHKYIYAADVLEGESSGVPALMGSRDMAELDIYSPVKRGSFAIPGPGGLNLGGKS